MATQLPLSAGWPRQYVRPPDPRDRFDRMLRDRDEAKAAIREILEKLAEKHGVEAWQLTSAMLSVEDTLSDLLYEVERGLRHEIEYGERG